MLYLAFHLPRLALDLAFLSREPAEPWALIDTEQRPPRIHACTAAAAAQGIEPGQTVASALALSATLQLRPRQMQAEQAALQRAAAWALQFSPAVSVQEPDSVLLEIASCLDYFGGLSRLLQQVRTCLPALAYEVRIACAPSTHAAVWLARHGPGNSVTSSTALEAALAPLPVTCLPLTARQHASLGVLGVQTLGQLLQLPRAGIARRLGPALAHLLEQALGHAADVRPLFQAPEQFSSRLELSWASERCSDLLQLVQHMLGELCGYLAGRNLGVQSLDLELEHENRSRSTLTVGCGRPSRQRDALLAIVRERLERHELAAPVAAVTLRAPVLHALAPLLHDLFDEHQPELDVELLHDRLRARLGEAALQGVALAADHRPEHAWQPHPPGRDGPCQTRVAAPRPAWLLDPPQALALRDHRPWHGEPLHCIGRAERIESGWWDADPVRRDYFLARGQQSGRLLWIFRTCQDTSAEQQWFLHGLFD